MTPTHCYHLIYHLPAGSAFTVAQDPRAFYRPEMWMLRAIEHDIRGLAWSLGGGKGEKPKPVDFYTPKKKPKLPTKKEVEQTMARLDQAWNFPEALTLAPKKKEEA